MSDQAKQCRHCAAGNHQWCVDWNRPDLPTKCECWCDEPADVPFVPGTDVADTPSEEG